MIHINSCIYSYRDCRFYTKFVKDGGGKEEEKKKKGGGGNPPTHTLNMLSM